MRDLRDGRETAHTLVGASESDPANGRLSIDSPLGRALAGGRVGDEIAFDAPRGQAPARDRRARRALNRRGSRA